MSNPTLIYLEKRAYQWACGQLPEATFKANVEDAGYTLQTGQTDRGPWVIIRDPAGQAVVLQV